MTSKAFDVKGAILLGARAALSHNEAHIRASRGISDRVDIAAEQVVTFCRTETTTGQTVVIDAGRFFH
jgi:hypothetical protein